MEDSGSKEEQRQHQFVNEFLNKTEASDIMIPRSQVTLIDSILSFNEIVNLINKDGHSRFPVYTEKIDNIVGILYAKSLLEYIRHSDQKQFDMIKILRKPLFISENKKASDLFAEFIKTHTHMAIVVDEYGTFLGIVTLEDVMEEIVGDISDEFDKEKKAFYSVISPKESMVLPGMSIEEFNQVFKTRIKSEDYDTIGGFIIDHFGYVPKAGECVQYKHYEIVIESVEGSKILKILVKKG